ncbi:cell division protein FtsL [Lentisalinibacter salinarum]|uniref:cell division protein FtsL n=1 Tax=Lentisalinibacter salinarum TaxID=2992239 RepID=UPI00386591BF
MSRQPMKALPATVPLSLTLVLALACVASAMAIIHTRQESRELFVQLQELSGERDALNIEWGRLQIEQSAYATHARVERIARRDLELERPQTSDIYIVKPE